MKKISIILATLALAMTMSQCKKNEGQPTSNDEVVTITLDVKQNNSSKVVVNPASGTVNFESGDKIYVGSGGKYVGFLTHNGTNFSGNITNPTENQPLQFYFLGNVTPQETLSAGTTEECSVIISDQTEHLPVISCAASNENYVSGLTAYSAHLLNKCALVKFNVTTPSNSPICITGMKNKVTVDFTNNTITPSQDGEGVIMLSEESGEKWSILLPQQSLGEGEEGTTYSFGGNYIGIRPEMPAIIENGYYGEGIVVPVNTFVFPVGGINGLFTINGTGEQVFFSQGNLQYIGSAVTPYWKFAEHQWDYLGSTTGQNGSSEIVDRDLFGWGTSGYNHGAICYQPWSTSTDEDDYKAYGSYTNNLYNQTGKADWGYNPIDNGGNQENLWRTLSNAEWNYLFNTRVTLSGIRYAKGNINGTNGVILLPDDWNSENYQLVSTNNYSVSYTTNNITVENWINYLEANGAVFLPKAGYRSGTSLYDSGMGYWSSSYCDDERSFVVEFSYYGIIAGVYRDEGYSVRLVQDYNP